MFEGHTALKSVKSQDLTHDFEVVRQAVVSNRVELQNAVGDKFPLYWSNIESVHDKLRHLSAGNDPQYPHQVLELIDTAKDLLSADLDRELGDKVTDLSVFKGLTVHWEREYFKDMSALNVLQPDVLTRVTEYIPEIIQFVERVEKNGLAYAVDGSVYFNTGKYKETHQYPKLSPEN